MKKRDFLKTLPLWITPVVGVVNLPAHAQTSPVIDTRLGGDDPDDLCTQDAECGDTFPSFKMSENVVCNQGTGASVCPIAFEIITGAPTRPARYNKVYETGFIDPIGFDCYDFTSHLPDASTYGLYIYCIKVYQIDCHPEEYTQYCFGAGK